MDIRKSLSNKIAVGLLIQIGIQLTPAFAANAPEKPPGKVVDLGETSVNGEVRRPSITWIDSQKSVRDDLPEVFRKEFDEFEGCLLKEENHE